ncbi:MAG: 30S ribosomal protein S16 [Gemmatimonadaceae bacterium]
MVRIRLRRIGRKKAPVYRIVVADSQSPRDGKFIEIIGQYAPRQTEGGLNVNEERANYWMNVGAQPSDTVRSLLRRAGVLKRRHETRIGRVSEAPASVQSGMQGGMQGGSTQAASATPMMEEQPDMSNVIAISDERLEEE